MILTKIPKCHTVQEVRVMKEKTVQVSFRATESCKKAIDDYMRSSGLTKSDAIRRLIEQGDSKVIVKDLNDIVQILKRHRRQF